MRGKKPISIGFFNLRATNRRQDCPRRGRGLPGTWEVPHSIYLLIRGGVLAIRPETTPVFGQNPRNPGFGPTSGLEKIIGNPFFRRNFFFPASSSPSPSRSAGRNPNIEKSILGRSWAPAPYRPPSYSIGFFNFEAASRRRDCHSRGRALPYTWEVPH